MLALITTVLYMSDALLKEECAQAAVLRDIGKHKATLIERTSYIILEYSMADTVIWREVRSLYALIDSLDQAPTTDKIRQDVVLARMHYTGDYYNPVAEKIKESVPSDMSWLFFKADLNSQLISGLKRKYGSTKLNSNLGLCISEILIMEGEVVRMNVTPFRNWRFDSTVDVFASGLRLAVSSFPFKYTGNLNDLEVVLTHPYTGKKKTIRYE